MCKCMQPCWPTTPNIIECYMFCLFAHFVECCCMFLGVVAQKLKPVKILSQHLLTFLLFCDCCSKHSTTMLDPFAQLLQHCWCHARTFHNHGLQTLMGCIIPTMHCRFQHYCELFHLFSHYYPHCQPNNIGSCCVGLHIAKRFLQERRGGNVAKWSGHTHNPVMPGLSPTLATCWICSRLSQAQILGHACKQPTGCLLPVGVLNAVMLYLNYLFSKYLLIVKHFGSLRERRCISVYYYCYFCYYYY